MHQGRSIRTIVTTICLLSAAEYGWTAGRGPSPYLPLNMSPRTERQIQKLLILADKPVMRRPIPAAVVVDALPRACEIDSTLCKEVQEYLRKYMQSSGITMFQAEIAASTGDSRRVLPNKHGLQMQDSWQAAVSAYYQPSDYVILNVGGVAYDGDATPTGSMLSAGFEFAQLDVGYRDHWFSPLLDSSSLISTQAPTMPSVTLSNYRPISPLGLNYELFLAEMTRQDGIPYRGSTTSGRPRLTGMQLGMEPVSGYALAFNRLFQFGGGDRGYGGLSGLVDAFYKNSNRPDSEDEDEFGNQIAAVSSNIIFPGAVPFSVRVEYAGEDNAYAGNQRLGATNLSLGLDFPVLWRRLDLSLETSEWQNVWYVHHLYPRGMTNDDHVIGHWFGDERVFGDAISGSSQMLRLGWTLPSGDYFEGLYRTLDYEPLSAQNYQRLDEFLIRYSTNWQGHTLAAEIAGGHDVFGESYGRLAFTFDLAKDSAMRSVPLNVGGMDSSTELFVDIGASYLLKYELIGVDNPADATHNRTNLHVGVGARRRVWQKSDIGARLELDRIEDRQMLSLRAVDYRYRFNNRFAGGVSLGVGRYDVGLPCYGFFWGAGVQLMDVLPQWDLALEARQYDKLGRDKQLPEDPPILPGRTRIFFDVIAASLSLSRRF